MRQVLEKALSNPYEYKNKRIFLWGTGNTSELYKEGLNRLCETDQIEIFGFGDNNKAKQGTLYQNKMVYSAEEIAEYSDALVLIVSPQKRVSDAVSKQLTDLKIENYLIDDFLFKLHSKEVLAVYDLMEDEKSREIYCKIALGRMKNDLPTEDMYTSGQYFCIPQFLHRNTKQVFVDCGGYVGDTIEQYLWKMDGQFGKIISFEPDLSNVSAMSKRVKRLKEEWNLKDEDIEILPFGVSDVEVKGFVSKYNANHGLGSKLSDATELNENVEEVKIVKLDDVISCKVDFLKADIESYEYRMIKGASNIIKNDKPMLAICIYHNGADFFQIPLMIKEMVPDYKFAVRQHSYDLDDTVLYAWV